MELPKNDPNLMIAFHYYNPMLFTHYATPWTKYRGPVHYPGYVITDEEWDNVLTEEQRNDPQAKWWHHVYFSKADMLQNLRSAKLNADRLGLRIHCGEFACTMGYSFEDSIRWLQDMTSTLREIDIPGAYWPFGLGERFTEDGKAHPEVIKALTGKDIRK